MLKLCVVLSGREKCVCYVFVIYYLVHVLQECLCGSSLMLVFTCNDKQCVVLWLRRCNLHTITHCDTGTHSRPSVTGRPVE